MEPLIPVPESVSFEDAITLTQTLLEQWEQGQLAEAELEAPIAALVKTYTGARGFFVVYLSDTRASLENLYPTLIPSLKTAPDIVSELLVKNLAMSTAMEMVHRRNGHAEMAQQSAQVQRRSAALMKQLDGPQIQRELQQLWVGLSNDAAPYGAFLQRWGYDAAQRQAIATYLQQLFPGLETPATDVGTEDTNGDGST
ncbi:MAG TPA: hypothetical protein V6D19_21195 [Stenomitos sp.]